MRNSYSFAFSALEMAVRQEDDSAIKINVISCYVHCGLDRAKAYSSLQEVRSGHMRVINNLIETMCDSRLSLMWRKQCYRYVKRLMPLLFEMLNEKEYSDKVKEINTLCSFFIHPELNIVQRKMTINPSTKNN